MHFAEVGMKESGGYLGFCTPLGGWLSGVLYTIRWLAIWGSVHH